MEEILASLAKWLSSGPLGIILGIFGLGGIGAAVAYFAKKLREGKFQKDITAAAETTGRESEALSRNMRDNTSAMDAAVAEEEKKQLAPKMYVVGRCESGVSFYVITTNVPLGTPIMADEKWEVGKVAANGTTQVVLVDPGKRVISVKVRDIVLSSTIEITKETNHGN